MAPLRVWGRVLPRSLELEPPLPLNEERPPIFLAGAVGVCVLVGWACLAGCAVGVPLGLRTFLDLQAAVTGLPKALDCTEGPADDFSTEVSGKDTTRVPSGVTTT